MRKVISAVFTLFVVVSMHMPCFAEDSAADGGKKYGDPKCFEKEIQQFEAADKERFPNQNAIVCAGSSSMRFWHKTIKEDLAPLSVIPRGFGGSNMNDLLYYADRIVLCYKPRAVVVYEGDNDAVQGIAPERVADTFGKFVKKVHKKLPKCRIYFLSIKPSIARWNLWPEMKEANRLIAAECEKDKRLTYVDVSRGMLDDEGNPRKDIFKKDNLHMNRTGYMLWRDTLMEVLLKTELRYER